MARSTTHYAEGRTNNILKRLHNKLRPAGTPVQRVEYIIELLLLRIFEIKLRQDKNFKPLRKLFEDEGYQFLFSYLLSLPGEQIKSHLNKNIFPFYSQILSKARKVFKENLPQKVQDNLVLIEEVFANSSFSTNVQSGNMTEIIGLVSEIDETAILKTDILGDTIESALSETGGTQDIGLYRTPEHIRQMMVAMADPTFYDTIFDPACGTGGFLFDAYHYCLEKVIKDKKWPSQKCPPSHPELNAYFEKFFQRFNESMPDIDTANRFYREGVSGIEYLGMIRKMAAINLYIRGLNPANIEQGDSLRLFDPAIDTNSKTLILSNPPFGAERDQPAYPNVWEEYARESETTVLFVKLMFDLLKKGGKCAVIVSEGFLTWDKTSARNLRKILLEQANLRAVISLPQGVFVSKQGQGAKTSILYFEKDGPTEWVWYYKIENDGFSMGVNRKPVPGCQIPEVIEIFTNYVRKGEIPPETKNSFIIPADWIKTLDPRLKERIRKETREQITIRSKPKKDKLIAQLKEKKDKGKITENQYRQKIEQFDTVLENKIQNETSKRIEKAHLYSFNFQTYRSDLTDEQIKDWKDVLKNIKPKDNASIDKKYQLLFEGFVSGGEKLDIETALSILASFNPKNALEMDIAREYLLKLDTENEKLKKLKEILKRGVKYPRVKLEKLLIPKYNKIRKDEYDGSFEIIEKIDFAKGRIHFRKEKKTGMDLYKAERGDLVTSKINLWQGAISLASFDLMCSTHYQVYSINLNEIDPKYLFYILRSKKFLAPIAEERSKGIKNEQGPKFLLKFSIPLPPLETQRQIVEKIEKQKAIIEGAEKILGGWEPHIPKSTEKKFLGEFIIDSLYGISSKLFTEGKFPVLRMNNLDILGNWHLQDLKYTNENLTESRLLKYGDFLFNRTNSLDLVGKCGVINFDFNGTWAGYLIRLRFNEKLNPFFLRYLFAQKEYRDYFKSIAKPAGGQANINLQELAQTKIDYFTPEIQRKIIKELDKEMQALEKVKMLKEKAEKRIEEILEEVWGEKEKR